MIAAFINYFFCSGGHLLMARVINCGSKYKNDLIVFLIGGDRRSNRTIEVHLAKSPSAIRDFKKKKNDLW